MPNTVGNLLLAARRSMEGTVIPAIDGSNPLAREQAQLVAQALRFLEQQLPYVAAKDRAELAAYRAMAEDAAKALSGDAAGGFLAELWESAEAARQIECDPAAMPDAMQSAAATLATLLSRLSNALDAFSPDTARAVRRAIIAGSKPVVDLHRAFFLPTGFDRDARELPPIDELVGRAAAPASRNA